MVTMIRSILLCAAALLISPLITLAFGPILGSLIIVMTVEGSLAVLGYKVYKTL